jgi:hypothetical protein
MVLSFAFLNRVNFNLFGQRRLGARQSFCFLRNRELAAELLDLAFQVLDFLALSIILFFHMFNQSIFLEHNFIKHLLIFREFFLDF